MRPQPRAVAGAVGAGYRPRKTATAVPGGDGARLASSRAARARPAPGRAVQLHAGRRPLPQLVERHRPAVGEHLLALVEVAVVSRSVAPATGPHRASPSTLWRPLTRSSGRQASIPPVQLDRQADRNPIEPKDRPSTTTSPSPRRQPSTSLESSRASSVLGLLGLAGLHVATDADHRQRGQRRQAPGTQDAALEPRAPGREPGPARPQAEMPPIMPSDGDASPSGTRRRRRRCGRWPRCRPPTPPPTRPASRRARDPPADEVQRPRRRTTSEQDRRQRLVERRAGSAPRSGRGSPNSHSGRHRPLRGRRPVPARATASGAVPGPVAAAPGTTPRPVRALPGSVVSASDGRRQPHDRRGGAQRSQRRRRRGAAGGRVRRAAARP